MASATPSTELGADERYQIAVCYGTIIATGSLALVVSGARLYTRKFILDAFALDDWATLIALIVVTVFNGIGIGVTANGAGKHINHVSQEDLQRWFLLYYVCICIYLLISFCVKSSLLLFQLRLFPVPYVQWAAKGLLAFMVLFTVSGTFVAAFQCTPPKYAFDLPFLMSPERAQHCFKPMVAYAVFLYQAVLLFAVDIVILLLPLPALWSLKLTRGKGVVLLLIFGSGLVACIAPALRFQSLNFYKTGSTDTTFVAASSLYWMAIEYNLGLVAGSLACLQPLFIRLGLVTGTSAAQSSAGRGKQGFHPSYQLDNVDGGMPSENSWRGKISKKWNVSDRVQGESVLDTVMTRNIPESSGGDSTDDDVHSRKHINGVHQAV
ncbi:hypothetical protein VTK73DRAFT_5558 [Phialemonium thermophilum]|uniref:Rhodopsin domain-containing protein n=1 Tax=Phialemonium thermophilum TaxID=223376 RepID=A0ABR3XXX7_9PEZI